MNISSDLEPFLQDHELKVFESKSNVTEAYSLKSRRFVLLESCEYFACSIIFNLVLMQEAFSSIRLKVHSLFKMVLKQQACLSIMFTL